MSPRTAPMWAWILIASCTGSPGRAELGRSVSEVHGESATRPLQFLDSSSPLRARKQIPVLFPPEVFAVYVPTHVDPLRDLMVGEHWVFFKLRESSWLPEQERRIEPQPTGPARESDLLRLRTLKAEPWKNLLVPYREGTKE